MKKLALFDAKGWEADYLREALTKAGFECDVYENNLDSQNLPEKKDYQAISVFISSKIDKPVIDHFPGLELITTRSTGFDHIDLAYAREKGSALGYVPYYGENTVAEFAIGLILTLSRKLYWSIDRIKKEAKFSFEGLRGTDLRGKTLGVIGAGHIGQHVIRMAKGFEMNIIAFDRYPKPELAKELGFEYKSMDEILGQSDFITLHLFYAPETHHIINKESIKKIKRGAYLINTARGPLIETEALVMALKDGTLAGAGLDVLEEEDILKDEMGYWLKFEKTAQSSNMENVLYNHILMDMPNVIITPHNAFNTKEAITRILDTDITNIAEFFSKGAVKEPIK
jgi:D-lactate dehydrogenase